MAIRFGNRQIEIPILSLLLAQRRLRRHIDRFEPRLRFVLRRTNIHTNAAARAVFGRDLNGVFHSLPFAILRVARFEGGRRAGEMLRVVHLDADHTVRTDNRALAALKADARIPDRDFERQVALLPLGRSRRVRAVARERAHGQLIAMTGDDLAQYVTHERGRSLGYRRGQFDLALRPLGDSYFVETLKRPIHGVQIHLDDFFALLVVGLADRVFDRLNRLALWQRSRERKKADLHDRIDTSAHAALERHPSPVNDEEPKSLAENLHLRRA